MNKKILIAFFLSFLFWTYLAFSSQMNISFDAIGFEQGGQAIASEGLRGYLQGGAQKEPLYAYSISLSMKLADAFQVDYKKIQACLQIFLLLLGQIFLFRILLHLKLNENITTATLLYYGFSPSLINCGFSLFSEIITLPLVLMSIFFIYKAWRHLLMNSLRYVVLYSFLFTFSAVLAIFSKAALILVYPLLLMPFMVVLAFAFIRGRIKQGQGALALLIIFFSAYFITINTYKDLNKKYHGVRIFADDRGSPMLYTLAIKRTAPLTAERIGMALSSIPGQSVCKAFYGDEACYYWLFDGSADLGLQKVNELSARNMPREKIYRTLILSAAKQALSNPAQYSLFVFLESVKMFFWESTQGFVSFPPWMTRAYNNTIFKNVLRFVVSLMTLLSVIYAARYLLKNHRRICSVLDDNDQKFQCLFFLFLFMAIFIACYALVMTATRYSFPIAPIFIALIAFGLHEKLLRAKG